MDIKYNIPSEVELTQSEIKMFESHGIEVWQVDKMSKEELQEKYDWLIKHGY